MEVARRIKGTEDAAAEAAAMAEFNEKKWVWVADSTAGYLAGWIVPDTASKDGLQEVMISPSGERRTLPSSSLHPMNPPKFDQAEDMADLTHLHEAGVVENLRQRYEAVCGVEGGRAGRSRRGRGEGGMYTYSGLFLISLNPYKPLPIYTPAIIASYRMKRRDEVAPHIYAIAERAWCQMGEEGECQSVLITGESGAGKTENTKKVIQYLAAIAPSTASGSTGKSTLSASGSSGSIAPRIGLPRAQSFRGKADLDKVASDALALGTLERQILQANPILEAFGNAQTTRNNNSSRFGKFIRISFTPDGAIVGANVDWYLLEKSRVTYRAEAERSFHVFYQLLAARKANDLRAKLLLSQNPADYAFLQKSRTTIDGVDDAAEWELLKTALSTVGFTTEEQIDLFRIVAAILHVGNIKVTSDSSDQAMINSLQEAEKVCHLLGISVKDFTKAVLRPVVKAGREMVTQARTKRQAEDELAALCKTMYEKAFGTMVDRINKALDRPEDKSLFIGVLDIAGFEIFALNGYEQLLINFTNERLQQFFNHHMFVLEQEEYAREGIDWNYVNFGLDLQPTIELIEANQPMGILSTLDEECIMPKATDVTFLDKLRSVWEPSNRAAAATMHPGSAKFSTPRFGKGFIVQHYAGPVEYDVSDWLQKNKDPINDNVAQILSTSSSAYVSTLFAEFAETKPGGISTSNRTVKRGAFRTVAQRHRQQLASLMSQLQSTQPHFVRCIVPNSRKRSGEVDLALVLDQLRCNGVLEGIRIARLGYPNRLPFVEFRQRYEVLAPDVIPKGYVEGRKACLLLIKALDIPITSHKLGLTKIFFKAGVLASLEERRDAHLFNIFARFQADARMFGARRRLKRVLNRAIAVRTVQRNARVYLQLRDWPWWQLYTKLQPMLAASRQEEEIARQKAEALLAEERVKQERAEKAKMQALQAALLEDKRKVEEALAQERDLASQKDLLLSRSKATEAELQEEITALQNDIDVLEEQLESAESDKRAAEARCDGLRREYALVSERGQALLQQESKWQARAAELEEQLRRSAEDARRAELQAASLKTSAADLGSKIDLMQAERDRSREKSELAAKDVQARVEEERALRLSAQARLSALESECRKKDDQIAIITRDASESRRTAQDKHLETAKLAAALAEARQQSEGAATGRAEMQKRVELLMRDRDDLTAQATAQTKAAANLQAEVDKLRRSIADKMSQEKLHADMERSKDAELASMRTEVTELKAKAAAERQRLSGDIVNMKSKLDEVQRLHESLQKAHIAAQEQGKRSQEALRAAQSDKESIDRQKQALQAELTDLRARHIATDKQLEDAIQGVQTSSRQVAAAQAKLADYEDAVLAIEHEKAGWAQKLDAATRDLASERSAREKLDREIQVAASDCLRHQAMAEQAQQVLAQAKLDIQARDTDIAVLKSRENKTVVEHVHVLEKAKRMTDRELAETRIEKDKLAVMLKSIESQRSRAGGEHDELVRQHEMLKTELRKEQQDRKAAQAEAANLISDAWRLKGVGQEKDAAVAQAKKAQGEVARLETQIRQMQSVASTTPASPRRAAGSSRLLQELQLNNEQLRHDMDEQLSRGGKVAIGSENAPYQRLSARKSLEGLASASKENDSSAAIKQQLLQLDNNMTAADRIQSHLLMQIEEITHDLEVSDGSKASLEATKAKLRQRNAELATLLQAQQRLARSADASNAASIQDIWKAFKAHIAEERGRFSTLDASRREMQSAHKQKVAEAETLTARLKETELRLKRLQNASGKEPIRAERASASGPDHADTEFAALEEEVMQHKLLADTHLARAEAAEIAKQQIERDLSLHRSDINRLGKQLEELSQADKRKAERLATLERNIREAEAEREDADALHADKFDAEVAKLMEKERQRYNKDLQDRDFTIAQTRAKYQGELAQLSAEQGHLRDEVSRAREEARTLKAKEEALRLQLDDELHASSSWKMTRDRMEARIGDLTKAFEAASADCASSQNQAVSYLAEIRELRGKVDELDGERAALRHTKEKLEQRIADAFDNQINASRLTRDSALQQLTVDKQELKDQLDTLSDQLELAKRRSVKSDSYAAECLEELAKIRQTNADLDKQNSNLEKVIKDLNVRIVDLTTQSYANSPRQPNKRLEQKLQEAQARLSQESQDRADLQRSLRALERSSKEHTALLETAQQDRDRFRAQADEAEKALSEMKGRLSTALSQNGELTLVNKRAERTILDLKSTVESLDSGRSQHGTPVKNSNRNSYSSPRRAAM